MLTALHTLIKDTAAKFSQTAILPFEAQWEKDKIFPREVFSQMGALGLMGMLVPEEYGGVNSGYLSYILAIEEIAKGNGAISTLMSVQNSVVNLSLLHFGSSDQKKEFLIPLAQGKILGAFCLTEPQAGSDATNLHTRAILEKDHYIINGVKQFITAGKNANVAIVIAVEDATFGKKGVSAFIVPTDTLGYKVSHLEEKMGQHCVETAQVVFDEVKIPKNYRLGNLGEGFKVAFDSLVSGRLGISAQALGMATRALNIAINYAKERETFGKKLIEHQAIGFKLADMITNLEAARAFLYQTALKKDNGITDVTLDAAMTKLFVTETCVKICDEAISILGGYGYLSEYNLERIYRDIRVTTIYEGSSDIQHIIIDRYL